MDNFLKKAKAEIELSFIFFKQSKKTKITTRFKHQQIENGTLITGELLKEFAKQDDFKITLIGLDGEIFNNESI